MQDIFRDILKLADLERPNLVVVNYNQAYPANLEGSLYMSGKRHLETKFYWIHDEIQNWFASMRYKPTNSMPVNWLTKALDCIKLLQLCNIIGLDNSGGSNSGWTEFWKDQIREDRNKDERE